MVQVYKKGNYFYVKEDLLSSRRTFAGLEYKKDDFLISGMTGLLEYGSGKDATEFKTDVNFSSVRIVDMKLDDQNALILATGGTGIYTLVNGKMTQHISKETGLSENNCNKIYISGNCMYVSTTGGVNILEKQNGRWIVIEI